MSGARRSRLRALLAKHDFGALLVTSPPNVRYLTGFTGSYGQVLVTADPTADVFVTDGRYAEQAASEVIDLRTLVVPEAGWLRHAVPPASRLGLEAHHIPWLQASRIRDQGVVVVAAPPLVETLRQIKDPDEIATLRRACDIADAAFADLVSWLRPGMSERTIAVRLERTMVDLGAEDRAFDTIVATGPNTAVPHHRPTERRLAAGDLVTCDFGARVDGYHSDMTRMLAFGHVAAELRDLVSLVTRSQRAGVAAAVPGSGTGDVDAACRAVLDAAGVGERFVHGTGHGVGLQIHEDPFLRPQQALPGLTSSPSVTLSPGMTVTVEPGVYLPGIGGVRIEDALLVTAAGPDVLTRTPIDLVVV